MSKTFEEASDSCSRIDSYLSWSDRCSLYKYFI